MAAGHTQITDSGVQTFGVHRRHYSDPKESSGADSEGVELNPHRIIFPPVETEISSSLQRARPIVHCFRGENGTVVGAWKERRDLSTMIDNVRGYMIYLVHRRCSKSVSQKTPRARFRTEDAFAAPCEHCDSRYGRLAHRSCGRWRQSPKWSSLNGQGSRRLALELTHLVANGNNNAGEDRPKARLGMEVGIRLLVLPSPYEPTSLLL